MKEKIMAKYLVKPEESLSKIAEKFYQDGSEASWRKIYEANSFIDESYNITPGMKLEIPGVNLGLEYMLEALGAFESGKLPGDPEEYTVENTLKFMGKYQFGEALLRDLGYYQPTVPYYTGDKKTDEENGVDKNYWLGTWTGKKGINSKEQFLDSPEVQEYAILEAFALNWERINETLAKQEKSVTDYVGNEKTFNDNGVSKTITITDSGLLAGAHLRGPYGVANLLLDDKVSYDEYGTSILGYIEEYGGYNVKPFLGYIEAYSGNNGNWFSTAVDGYIQNYDDHNPILGISGQENICTSVPVDPNGSGGTSGENCTSVPEPASIVGILIALGLAALFTKRKIIHKKA